MIGEESAIRAVYVYDRGFFNLLGILARAMDKSHPGLTKSYDAVSMAVSRSMISEDSAYRAQSLYTEANMLVLRDIVAALGSDKQARDIVHNVSLSNDADTSAVRDAMRNAEGSMQLLLVLVERRDADTARSLRRAASLNTLSDDSAIRSHGEFKDGIVGALRKLVEEP
jgi:hypothetical protein